jgi:prepilin-type N-terminal cleavage/methylation domain-containing protein
MLARLQKSMKEKDQGFTLIELLVVIVIIGILAAIAIPLFLNQRKKGVDASMKSDVKNAATTVETWIVDNPSSAVPAGDPSTSVALTGFTASTGNTIAVKPGTAVGSYCVSAINSSSSDAAKYILYKSDTGGLQSGFSASACP